MSLEKEFLPTMNDLLDYTTHTRYRYIDPSQQKFENCLPPRFVSKICFGQQWAAQPAKGALTDKLWKETIFKKNAQ